jgi:large subunit ribosomal protein L25
MKIKIHYAGTPAGVLKGGFKKERNNEIKIKAAIADLPETITADISKINVSEALRVKDLEVSKKVEVLTDAELPLVTVSPAR